VARAFPVGETGRGVRRTGADSGACAGPGLDSGRPFFEAVRVVLSPPLHPQGGGRRGVTLPVGPTVRAGFARTFRGGHPARRSSRIPCNGESASGSLDRSRGDGGRDRFRRGWTFGTLGVLENDLGARSCRENGSGPVSIPGAWPRLYCL